MKYIQVIFISITLIFGSSAFAQLSKETLKVLSESPEEARAAYKSYHEKHDDRAPVGKTGRADSETKRKLIEAYEKALGELEKSVKVGDAISDYPGILAHGDLRWNADSEHYKLTLGLKRGFPEQGTGPFEIYFDLHGRIVSKGRALLTL